MFERAVSLTVGFCLLFSSVFSVGASYAADIANTLPVPTALLPVSQKFTHPVLRGLRVDPKDPARIEFYLDTASAETVTQDEAQMLVADFYAALSISEKDLWVNLSPTEKDRVSGEGLADAALGDAMLAQDYLLKQFSSSLTHPDTETGKEYWKGGFAETSSKVWIVPEKADIYQKKGFVYIVDASLDVRAEAKRPGSFLAKIKEEVNGGETFARTRQIYHAVILAQWFKRATLDSLYRNVIDAKNVTGIETDDPAAQDAIWQRYCESFKKGAYSVSKRTDNPHQKRVYFSGGNDMRSASAVMRDVTAASAILPVDGKIMTVASTAGNGEVFVLSLATLRDMSEEDLVKKISAIRNVLAASNQQGRPHVRKTLERALEVLREKTELVRSEGGLLTWVFSYIADRNPDVGLLLDRFDSYNAQMLRAIIDAYPALVDRVTHLATVLSDYDERQRAVALVRRMRSVREPLPEVNEVPRSEKESVARNAPAVSRRVAEPEPFSETKPVSREFSVRSIWQFSSLLWRAAHDREDAPSVLDALEFVFGNDDSGAGDFDEAILLSDDDTLHRELVRMKDDRSLPKTASRAAKILARMRVSFAELADAERSPYDADESEQMTAAQEARLGLFGAEGLEKLIFGDDAALAAALSSDPQVIEKIEETAWEHSDHRIRLGAYGLLIRAESLFSSGSRGSVAKKEELRRLGFRAPPVGVQFSMTLPEMKNASTEKLQSMIAEARRREDSSDLIVRADAFSVVRRLNRVLAERVAGSELKEEQASSSAVAKLSPEDQALFDAANAMTKAIKNRMLNRSSLQLSNLYFSKITWNQLRGMMRVYPKLRYLLEGIAVLHPDPNAQQDASESLKMALGADWRSKIVQTGPLASVQGLLDRYAGFRDRLHSPDDRLATDADAAIEDISRHLELMAVLGAVTIRADVADSVVAAKAQLDRALRDALFVKRTLARSSSAADVGGIDLSSIPCAVVSAGLPAESVDLPISRSGFVSFSLGKVAPATLPAV